MKSEVAELLKRIGHPIKVAQKYFTNGYLIGPTLYPIYRHALRFGFFITVALYFVIALINGVVQQSSPWSFIAVIFSVIEIGFWVFAITTLVFAFMEYSGEKLTLFEKWNPVKQLAQNKIVSDRSDIVN